MTTENKHTQTPWRLVRRHPDPTTNANLIEIMPMEGGAFGEYSSIEIANIHCAEEGGIQHANALLIVEAVNNHARLTAQNKALREVLASASQLIASLASSELSIDREINRTHSRLAMRSDVYAKLDAINAVLAANPEGCQ